MTPKSFVIPIPAILIGALLALLSSPALAGKPTNVTDAEMALLPKYCPDTFGFKYGDAYTNTSPNAPKWVAMMGKNFWAMHHYCWALINLGRAQKPSMPPGTRDTTRQYAIDDLQYVIENTTPDFILLPEIYTKIGEVQIDLKRPMDARDSFARARSLKPDYWPPYFQWGQYLLQAGLKKDAREVVEEGLSYAPQSRALRSLLVELGGDPAKVQPRPLPEKPAEPVPEKQGEPAPEKQPEPAK
jgi:tetratricopeptide (TPR) repeat protein